MDRDKRCECAARMAGECMCGAWDEDLPVSVPPHILSIARELVEEHGTPDNRAATLAFWIAKAFG